MPTEIVNVLGAGGHSRVVIDALQLMGYTASNILVRDDRLDFHGGTILGCLVEVPTNPSSGLKGWVHAAVGSATIRQRLLEKSRLPTERWLTVVHPRASVSGAVKLGPGCLVAAQAIVAPCAQIKAGVIINHGAVVDHDCHVGDYSHIAPCASLGGGVWVGNRVLVGAGARVLPGVRIGDDVVIGAGAVVLTDIPSGQTWTGLPAYPVNKENK
jgi:sugar O-acyltransferase (sialic acid O-acetyltransferase NeuD family)